MNASFEEFADPIEISLVTEEDENGEYDFTDDNGILGRLHDRLSPTSRITIAAFCVAGVAVMGYINGEFLN